MAQSELDQLIQGVLTHLEPAFRLDCPVGGTTLARRLEEIMRGVGDSTICRWGTQGLPTELAQDEEGALTFLYRPHLFPGMDPELQLGHEVQFHLLPRRLPPDSPLEAAAVLESYCHLSGDLIGWRAAPGERLLVWMFDVSGHGIRAGFAAVVLKLLLEETQPGLPLENLAESLQSRFLETRNPEDPGSLYATGVLLRVAADGKAEYLSAGHVPLLLRRAHGAVERIPATGLPLVLLPDHPQRVQTLRLAPGDAVFLCTDGVVEATDSDGRMLGLDAVSEVVRGSAGDPADIASNVYDSVGRHHDLSRLDDDLTLLALKLR